MILYDVRTIVRPGSTSSAEVGDRHYRDLRKVFPWAGITCAADALRQTGVATAVRKRRQCVDVRTCEELTFTLTAGIPASRIVMHDDGITAAPIRRAVNARVGRVVVGCRQQAAVLAACADRPQEVVVDVSGGCCAAVIAAVLGHPRLELVGLHARLAPDATTAAYADAVARMIAQMAHIRREHGVILTRVSLAGGTVLYDSAPATSVLRGLASNLGDAFDDSCARFRFPRPAMTLEVR